jgi:hypothetical protein
MTRKAVPDEDAIHALSEREKLAVIGAILLTIVEDTGPEALTPEERADVHRLATRIQDFPESGEDPELIAESIGELSLRLGGSR